MTSYLSPQTRRTILAAQKDCIFPREATTLTDKLDFIVEEWRLIHEAADGALKHKAPPVFKLEWYDTNNVEIDDLNTEGKPYD